MTNEEMERHVNFIVEQQAQFSADIQQLKQLHVQADARMTRLETVVVNLANQTEARFASLMEMMQQGFTTLTAKVTEIAEAQKILTEAQAHTDQRLNVLIDIISERRNGEA
jgi:phage host-nuclease inhibitor protein Gam